MTFPSTYDISTGPLRIDSATGIDGTQASVADVGGGVLKITRTGGSPTTAGGQIVIKVSAITHSAASSGAPFEIRTYEAGGNTETQAPVTDVPAVQIYAGTFGRSKKFPPHICFMRVCIDFFFVFHR